MSITMPKFSNHYIKYETIKSHKFDSIDAKTGDYKYKYSEYEKYSVIKQFVPDDKKLYYLWGNSAYAMMFDYNCKRNDKIKKLINLCILVENKIKRDDIGIVFYDFVNDVFPLLDLLTIDEIKLIDNAHKIDGGPLYDKLKDMRTPHIFLDLFKFAF
jgi:hypothetical protein